MDKYLLQFFILLTFLLQVMASEKRFCLFSRHVKVYVVNGLPPNSPPLLMHCASGDNDLGHHTLTTGQNFHFGFCVSLTTLFFCHLWWNGKNIAFDVFDSFWPNQLCMNNVCYWEAKSDGIYNSKHYPLKNLTNKYNW
ncbi:hypothetical protein Pfo_029222 [Paulownia fortunei]|nr:hypothetical protein Pfo_029222 [Paulownia fortunei]